MENVIEIENLSVEFRLSREKINSLKHYCIAWLKREVHYEHFHALKNISLTIKRGEVIGIIGDNGAGKSTLLKVLAGIHRSYQGRVNVVGSMAPLIELGAGFDLDLTGIENIYLNGLLLGYSKAVLASKIDEIIAFSELEKFIHTPLKNYSSGMKARLGFSIATIVKPDILIVDEVLAVGDVKFKEKSEKKIFEMIHQGTTVLFVSHQLTQIKRVCQRVIWMEKGRIVKEGTPESVCDAYQRRKESSWISSC